eukprot:1642971-Prymnesium_polylepis.1
MPPAIPRLHAAIATSLLTAPHCDCLVLAKGQAGTSPSPSADAQLRQQHSTQKDGVPLGAEREVVPCVPYRCS